MLVIRKLYAVEFKAKVVREIFILSATGDTAHLLICNTEKLPEVLTPNESESTMRNE